MIPSHILNYSENRIGSQQNDYNLHDSADARPTKESKEQQRKVSKIQKGKEKEQKLYKKTIHIKLVSLKIYSYKTELPIQ